MDLFSANFMICQQYELHQSKTLQNLIKPKQLIRKNQLIFIKDLYSEVDIILQFLTVQIKIKNTNELSQEPVKFNILRLQYILNKMLPFYNIQTTINPFQNQGGLMINYGLNFQPIFQPYYFNIQTPLLEPQQSFHSSPQMLNINYFQADNIDNDSKLHQKNFDDHESLNKFQQQITKIACKKESSGIINRYHTLSLEKKQKYLKKNTQSNISNQVLSFLTSPNKSEAILINTCKKLGLNDILLPARFYCYLEVIKKHKRKYLNKKMLLNLCLQTPQNPLYSLLKKEDKGRFQVNLYILCKLIRILIKNFMDYYCPVTILTSKKIDKEGIMEHLKRRRQIRLFLNNEIKRA